MLRRERADFLPARVPTRPPTLPPAPRWSVRFETREVGGGATTPLDSDPAIPRAAPGGRIAVNAIASLAVVLVLGLVVVGTAPSLLGYRSIVVTSSAMSPSIGPGDIVILRDVGSARLGIGSVVEVEHGSERSLHRIVEVTADGYRVGADSDPAAEALTVDAAEVQGAGTVVVPLVGHPMLWLDEGRWLPLLVLAGAVVIAAALAGTAWLDVPSVRARDA